MIQYDQYFVLFVTTFIITHMWHFEIVPKLCVKYFRGDTWIQYKKKNNFLTIITPRGIFFFQWHL